MDAHSDDCLMIRYCSLSDEEREWWPSDFGGRADLCTCGAIPDAPAQRPDFAEAVNELRDFVESRER